MNIKKKYKEKSSSKLSYTISLCITLMFIFFILFFLTGEPRSLEGLFVYEEKSTAPPANDTIVVEQWTVIEV